MTEEEYIAEQIRRNVIITTIDKIYNWGRRSSVWPMGFGLACCAIEMICAAAARFDFARFGMEMMRPTPRQADLMIVAGTVNNKMAPQVVRLYDQMPEPKYVLAMGACAISGGPFKDTYNVVNGIDTYLPVDVYVPGCPPRPEALLEGFLKLHEKIEKETILASPWYRKEVEREVPVPILGPRGLVVPGEDE
jgi:NADH-quinone oxidoreductase B subunit